MKIVQRILERLSGLHFGQEYLCMDRDDFPGSLHIYEVAEGKVARELTSEHAFVGYSPVLFAFSPTLHLPETIQLIFSEKKLQPGEPVRGRFCLAGMVLKRIHQTDCFQVYEGRWGEHKFLPAWNQAAIDWHNRRYKKVGGNVHLPGNGYRQVQIAYSLPRTVALITVGNKNGYNLFPTDLHGPIGLGNYLVSLRHEGAACRQVKEAGSILLSEMDPHAAPVVYGLGKNHMKPLRDASSFPFASPWNRMPVPEGARGLRLLTLEESRRAGIHEILLFRVSHERAAHQEGTLAHVHNAYATWRYKHGRAGNYISR